LKKPILIASALFAALILFYFVFEVIAPEKEEGIFQGERFLPLKATDIYALDIVTREGLALKCVRASDGSWNILEGEKKDNASETIEDFLEAITIIPEIDTFTVAPDMLQQYGLQEPSLRLTLTDLTRKTYDILIGDKTPAASTGVYVNLSGSGRITILGAVLNWELFKLSSLFVFQDDLME